MWACPFTVAKAVTTVMPAKDFVNVALGQSRLVANSLIQAIPSFQGARPVNCKKTKLETNIFEWKLSTGTLLNFIYYRLGHPEP